MKASSGSSPLALSWDWTEGSQGITGVLDGGGGAIDEKLLNHPLSSFYFTKKDDKYTFFILNV